MSFFAQALSASDPRPTREAKSNIPKVGDENFADYFLRQSATSARGFEEFTGRFADRHKRNVDDLSQERQRVAAAAGSAAQSKFRSPGSGSFADQLEQTVRRGRARQGIINRGETAIANQQLKDRIAMVRSGIQRRGALQEASAGASRLRAGLELEKRNAKSRISQAYSGAAGFIVGGAARGIGSLGETPVTPGSNLDLYSPPTNAH